MTALPPPSAPYLRGELLDFWRTVATLAAVGVVFAIDLALPQGVGGGALYLVPVLLEARFRRRAGVWLVVALSALLLTVDALASANVGVPAWIVAVNRIIALVLLVVAAALVHANLRAAEILHNTENRIRALLESAAEAIFFIDERGKIRMANATAITKFGYAREELIGQSIDMLVPSDVRAHHHELRDRYNRAPAPRPMAAGIPLRAQCKDGTELPVEISLSHTRSADGVLVMAFVTDIRPRVEAEARLKNYAQRLEQSNRELEQFAFVASHDLQEPLRKIESFGERIEQRHGAALPPDARDYLDRMRRAATRMRTLIEDLLSFSRVRSRGRPFAPVDLGEVVRQALSDLELRVREHQAQIVVGSLPTVRGDDRQLQQMFVNLIGNAIKFARPGVPPAVDIHAESDGRDAWIVRVRDNGIGIAPEHRAKIFEIFQRLHGRGEYEGTGIGLAIVRRIVERHQGTIDVEPTAGPGTVFRLRLPAAASDVQDRQ